MRSRHREFRVRISIPDDVSDRDAADYIRVAVQNWSSLANYHRSSDSRFGVGRDATVKPMGNHAPRRRTKE